MSELREGIDKVQRYQAYISSCCESGCGESMDDNGDYILYSDLTRIIALCKAEFKREAVEALSKSGVIEDGKVYTKTIKAIEDM